MSWARRNFENENAKAIGIEVGELTNGEVLIRLWGPDSTSNNFVTRREAEQLRDALTEALSEKEAAVADGHSSDCRWIRDGLPGACQCGFLQLRAALSEQEPKA